MEYTVLTDRFGGVSYIKDPTTLGPALAQEARGLDFLAGVVKNRYGDTSASTGSTVTSAYEWNGTVITSTSSTGYLYFEYGGRLIRMPRVCGTTERVMYTTDGTTWHVLGIKEPSTAVTVNSATAGTITGTFTWFVTLVNAYGDESPPSPTTTYTQSPAGGPELKNLGNCLRYGTGDITNGSDTITNVTNIDYFRVGMQISSPSAGIPAGAYITAVDTGSDELTISANATATSAGIALRDAQVTHYRVYRKATTTTEFKLVVQRDVSTTSTYTDTIANESLGDACDTEDWSVLPVITSGCISPDGVLMGLLDEDGSTRYSGTLAFSDVGRPDLTSTDEYEIMIPESGYRVVYAMNRFIVLTAGEVITIVGNDVTDFQIVPTGVQCPVAASSATSHPGAPVERPDGLRVASTLGVVNLTLGDVQLLTREVLTEAANGSLGTTVQGACQVGERYFVLYDHTGSNDWRVLIQDPRLPGQWHFLDVSAYTGAGTLINGGGNPQRAILYANATSYNLELPTNSRKTNGVYWTGNWRGERLTALKKIRDIVVLHTGNVTVQPYVDDVAVGSALAFSRTALGPSTFRLPSGTKGRVVSVKTTLTNAAAAVYEVGAHVGEERQVVP
jgi:hypothetical protein